MNHEWVKRLRGDILHRFSGRAAKKYRLFVHCTFAVEPFPISWTKWASQVLIKKRRPQRHRTPIVICAKNIKECELKLWISEKYVVWLNLVMGGWPNLVSCQWFAIQSMSNMLTTRLNTRVDQSQVKGQVPDIQRYGILRKYNVWHFYQNFEIKQKHFGNVDLQIELTCPSSNKIYGISIFWIFSTSDILRLH